VYLMWRWSYDQIYW